MKKYLVELTFQAGMDLPCDLRWRKGAKGLFAAQCGFGCSFARSLARPLAWPLAQDGLTERSNLWFKSRAEIHSETAARAHAAAGRESASFYAAKVRPSSAAFVVDPRLLALKY